MIIKGITDECLSDYREISMYIAMPHCSFKCDKENGCALCQNSALTKEPDIHITVCNLIERFESNPLTNAVIFGGLEPFDSETDLHMFIDFFRKLYDNDIVIYTGYTEDEVRAQFKWIYNYNNIIIKYGRFRPNCISHYDNILGVNLASDNQYAVRYD